jgi:hypothetical protein
MKTTKFALTEEQIEELRPVFEAAEKAAHPGIIVAQLHDVSKSFAMFIPYEDARYLQAVIFVAQKGKSISEIMHEKQPKALKNIRVRP